MLMISRRKLLLGSALGTTVALAARQADAFSIDEVPLRSGIGLALSNRCSGDSEHAQIASDLGAQLTARHARAGTMASATCPICGCPITITISDR
jgi:hypothetical protein